MKLLRLVLFLALSLILCGGALAAADSAERTYPLADHGSLILHLPAGWNDEVRKHPGDFPPTILLSGFEGSPFVVMITPLWPKPGAAADFASAQNIHTIVAKAARAAEPEAVEGKVIIVSLGGGKGPGYYFSATDRAPQPGDFKYMTQGAARVGQLVCTFTILSNDPKSVVKNKVLDLVSRADWRPDK